VIRTAGGRYDPAGKHIYFIASHDSSLDWGIRVNRNILFAVNEIESEANERRYEQMLDNGITCFLDSGIYGLASAHCRAHKVPHNLALTLQPEQVDGWDEHLEKYLRICRAWEDKLWGYVELDLGGRDTKRRTRKMLEAQGLRPVPVYHPLSDGWDYFDELAENYDRICLGNIVMAPPPMRLRLLATIHERKQKYPHLWIHALGLTANQMTIAYPVESCDSSSWLTAVRWFAASTETAATQVLSKMPERMRYRLGDAEQSRKAHEVCAYQAHMRQVVWNAVRAEQEQYLA
jgi:hypothetical protein